MYLERHVCLLLGYNFIRFFYDLKKSKKIYTLNRYYTHGWHISYCFQKLAKSAMAMSKMEA